MGVYDVVRVPCPACGHEEFFQSKGSEARALREFTLADCPEDVLNDINRHSPHQCEQCECCFAVDEATRTARKAAAPFEEAIRGWYSREPTERWE